MVVVSSVRWCRQNPPATPPSNSSMPSAPWPPSPDSRNSSGAVTRVPTWENGPRYPVPMQTIAVLGVGAMGTAIVQGLESSGWGKLDLRLADTDGQRVTELVGDGYLAWTDPTLAAESARVVVLAVKP